MAKPLSDLEASFVEEYIRDHNGTRAALRAGYEGTYAGRRQWARTTLAKPHIKRAIEKSKRERAEACKISLQQLVDEHMRTATDPDCPHGARAGALREVARLCGIGGTQADDLGAALQRAAEALASE